MVNKQYPEWLEDEHINNALVFELFDGSDSYEKDYKNAVEYSDKVGGVVYTMVDGDNNHVEYIKGKWFINRLGYAVVLINTNGVYCNKCDKKLIQLNDLEAEELNELGAVVCSDCINEETINNMKGGINNNDM